MATEIPYVWNDWPTPVDAGKKPSLFTASYPPVAEIIRNRGKDNGFTKDPWKVVTLQALVENGQASLVYVMQNGNSSTYDFAFYKLSGFKRTLGSVGKFYLPLGDVCIPLGEAGVTAETPNGDPTALSKIMVLLCNDSSEYSTKATASLYSNVGDTFGQKGSGEPVMRVDAIRRKDVGDGTHVPLVTSTTTALSTNVVMGMRYDIAAPDDSSDYALPLRKWVNEITTYETSGIVADPLRIQGNPLTMGRALSSDHGFDNWNFFMERTTTFSDTNLVSFQDNDQGPGSIFRGYGRDDGINEGGFRTYGIVFDTSLVKPSAPTNVAAEESTTISNRVTVTFEPPNNLGIPAVIDSYEITPIKDNVKLDSKTILGTAARSVVFDNLAAGSYRFIVTATNTAGKSVESNPTEAIIITSVVTAPGSPTNVTATSSSFTPTSAQVSWIAPANTGGSAITQYTVTSNPPGGVSTPGTTTSAMVTNLQKNVSYTFTVTATNATGTSPSSQPSPAVIVGVDGGGGGGTDDSSLGIGAIIAIVAGVLLFAYLAWYFAGNASKNTRDRNNARLRGGEGGQPSRYVPPAATGTAAGAGVAGQVRPPPRR